MLNKEDILRLYMERQHLLRKADKAEYEKLFRMMSPVTTEYWSRPGDPPHLAHRAAFDDLRYNDDRRSRREIVKGRFQKGGVGYVCPDELDLFAGLYRTDLGKLTRQEFEILNLLEHEGSMNIRELKAVTGMYVKDLTPILHRLQEAFKIYEDQRDREWDRQWYAFENEFPEIDVRRYSRLEALKIVLMRFAQVHVCFDLEMARSFFRLPKEDLANALEILFDEGKLGRIVIDGAEEYIGTDDKTFLETHDLPAMKPSVFLMHRNDFLVRSLEHELKIQFRDPDHGVLFYLLIDGEFRGCLFGRFTFGPVELQVLKLDLDETEIARRKTEILAAVYRDIDPEASPLPRMIRNDR
ncbi:MAG TPA: hypothetical protein P5154_01915 [Candidatus Izemoplasmatales bacterium]|nr:hypothetical protein [Candidatus Izemoplasmatales bacterium]